MTPQCIWIRCKAEPWTSNEERSHFCLEHAWRAAKRGMRPSHFLPNDAQREAMKRFPEALSNRLYFPLSFIKKRR